MSNKVTLVLAGENRDLSRALKQSTQQVSTFQDKLNKASTAAIASSAAMSAGVSGAALIAGGALAALPLAFAGLGVAAAAQSAQVQSAFTGLKDHVVSTVQQLAKPFEPVLVGIAQKARSTFDTIAPTLGKMFADSAPMFDRFASAVLKLVEGAMPGISQALSSAGPAVDAMANGLAGLGPAIGQFFANLSGGAANGTTGINMLFGAINWLIPAIGSVLGFMAEWSSVIIPLSAAIAAVALTVQLVSAATAAWAAIQTIASAATKIWAGAQWLLNVAMSANPIGLIIIAVAALVAAFIWLWNNVEGFRNFWIACWEWIKNAFNASVNFLVHHGKQFIDFYLSIPGRILGAFQGLAQGIRNAFASAFNAIASLWNNGVGRLSFTMPDWIPGMGGKGFSMPRIPRMHTGGVVPGFGQDYLALLQGGERVVANGQSSSAVEVQFKGNTDTAFASFFMQLLRTGLIQLSVP